MCFETALMHTQTSHTSYDTHMCAHIDTYVVQDVEISEGSVLDSICITCIFAQGTSAQGCYVSLLENHNSMVANTTGLRIEREGDSLNATGCVENLEGGLYHVVVYDIEADGTVDWHNRALLLTAALNWTFTSDQSNTSRKEPSPTVDESTFLFFCSLWNKRCKKLCIKPCNVIHCVVILYLHIEAPSMQSINVTLQEG